MKAIIIMGSSTDEKHARKITDGLDREGIAWTSYVASAHKQPREVLRILEAPENQRDTVFVTIAGRSNALSGFVAANTDMPTIACPPFRDKLDMLVNIHSTLQMPSQTPVLTVLDPGNCALAVKRILAFRTHD
ncbi:MAG: AIR carboxylase family protein [Candidatus Neomarinimicrobiota bacterium]|nr:MAG: AIR carboxylase family protein [Candidatus Neomarinimicrobiota bacterium]